MIEYKNLKKAMDKSLDIYSMDGFDRKPRHNVIVLVHPFYEYIPGKANPGFFYPFSTPEKYEAGINNLIKNYSDPIITFEEADRMHYTAKYFSKIGPKKNRIFVRTRTSSPTPLFDNWENVTDFVKGFGKDKVLMAGGRLYNYPEGYGFIAGNEWYSPQGLGCLGATAFRMSEDAKLGVRIMKNLIFK